MPCSVPGAAQRFACPFRLAVLCMEFASVLSANDWEQLLQILS